MIRKNRFLLSTISVASFVMKLLSGFDLFDIDALQLCNVLLIAVRYGRLFCSVQLHHSAAGADGACHFLTYQLDNGAAFKRAYNSRQLMAQIQHTAAKLSGNGIVEADK